MWSSALQFVQWRIRGDSELPAADGLIRLRHGRVLFCQHRWRGCVCFSVLSASELVEVLARVGGFTSPQSLLMEFFGNFLGIEAAFFHSFQCWNQGEDCFYNGHIPVAVELGELRDDGGKKMRSHKVHRLR